MEVLAPGGSLQGALQAYEAGADAVYAGRELFSARAGAQNLNLHDFRVLAQAAKSLHKKLYLTLNTLLKEEELPLAMNLVEEAALFGAHGVIVQDAGLAGLVSRHFPQLPLHASTQMAVHHESGVRTLQDMGFTRVVLSRELTLEEIQTIISQVPDFEYEVFVHGALCYGFSGLCSASHQLTGRSANRGVCSQICRSWFTDSTGQEVFPFSSTDLEAGKNILKLSGAGVTSFKIEGRLKSPEYAAYASRYYRSLLDGKEDSEAGDRLRTTFQRRSSTGFLVRFKSQDLVSKDFPGHRGLPLGEVLSRKGSTSEIRLKVNLSVRDGVLALQGRNPYTFAVKTLVVKGKRVTSAQAGQIVLLETPPLPPGAFTYYKSASHDNLLKLRKAEAFKPLKIPVHAKIQCAAASIVLETEILGERFRWESPISWQVPESDSWQDKLLSFFQGSSHPLFELFPSEVDSAHGSHGFFIPPAEAKVLRKRFLGDLETEFQKQSHQRRQREKGWLGQELQKFQPVSAHSGAFSVEGPLLMFPGQEGLWKDTLFRVQKSLTLMNWGQVSLAKDFLSGHVSPPTLQTGWPLYCANSAAVLALCRLIPTLSALTIAPELSPEEVHQLKTLIPQGLELLRCPERLPLFVSRTCHRRHVMGFSCEDCPQAFSETLIQNKEHFQVEVVNCITTVYGCGIPKMPVESF